MNTLSCESQQLVKSLAMAIWVREALAVITAQHQTDYQYPAVTAAHESASVSVSTLVESLETMIVLQESEHAAGGKYGVVRDLRDFVDDVMAMVGARMPKR